MNRGVKCPYEATCNLTAVTFIKYFSHQLSDAFAANGWRTIGVLGSDSAFREFSRCVGGFRYLRIKTSECWHCFEEYDVVIDFTLDSYLRGFLPFGEKLVSLVDILLPIAVSELKDYAESIGVGLLFIDGPRAERVGNLNPVERRYIDERATFERIAKDDAFLHAFCVTERDYSFATDKRLGVFGGWRRSFNGFVECLEDVESEYVNVTGGVRKSSFTPDSPNNFIHIFGSCLAQGVCVTDEHTIESYLQDRLSSAGVDCAVVNHGVGDGRFVLNDIVSAMLTPVNDADLIVILDDMTKVGDVDIVDSSDWFANKGADEVMFFNNAYHTNATANGLMADRLYDLVCNKITSSKAGRIDYFSWKKIKPIAACNVEVYEDNIIPYLRRLSRLRDDVNVKSAAVLVNADPFTLGHRHLVEKSLERYSHVYVFLLDQEAYFSFEDRYEMAVRGVSGLPATVIRTESFYASAQNFPEYFNRSAYKPGTELSRSVENDLRILDEKVFPFLRIVARYVGEEAPLSVTWKYNELVRRIDREYGIETCEIPRLRLGGKIVSASKVRESFVAGEVSSCKWLVSEAVFEYLKTLSCSL